MAKKKKSAHRRRAARPAVSRKVGSKKARPKRRAPRKAVGKAENGLSTRSRTHTDYNRNKVNISVGAVNKHKKAAKDKLLILIGREEVKKFTARLVRHKKKIAKRITKLKQDYRRLSL
jgi:alpha-N-acetylglucosamine transferase